jgi:DNA-binding NarL/FixJ family response regulator
MHISPIGLEPEMILLLLVEDNDRLRQAMKTGLESTGRVKVIYDCESGEEALDDCLAGSQQGESHKLPEAILMDVQLAGELNGIQAAAAIRREFPRLPVVFYSIQDDDSYFRDFRQSGILTHYAYVRKTNYLLPVMILPLLKDAIAGRSFIDPEIETRLQEVRRNDEQDPLALLEPNERSVAQMLAAGLTNEQIAYRMGFRDKRTISRTNGQIYAAWGLSDTNTDEKVARTRAALIVQSRRMIIWDDKGEAYIQNEQGKLEPWVEG